jgi:hypothetical protein
MAQTSWKQVNMSTIEGESIALLKEIRLTSNMEWENVIFESDSQVLVDSIYSNSRGPFEFSNIVSSIIFNLSLHSSFEVKFIR